MMNPGLDDEDRNIYIYSSTHFSIYMIPHPPRNIPSEMGYGWACHLQPCRRKKKKESKSPCWCKVEPPNLK